MDRGNHISLTSRPYVWNQEVPIAPIRRIALEWERRQDYTQECNLNFPNQIKSNEGARLSPTKRFAFQSGVSLSTVEAVFYRQSRKYVSFDVADRIVCAIDPHLWHADPELREIYYSFDLAALDRLRPCTEERMAA